ncbi:Endonuclease/Exonuclease/phosphatase family protein [Rosistilla oblonga]|uniref:endonuclease/exonuclease/phosphatase family protein n=1 Tax=Rosistilla oblonga TaxID=2527990 RepID=UPI001187A2B7|nr:endonuclease/exonuclease/phosphatase family protein [Rosistilla oblonga]QDV12394.1 Endonuclease/Exonuclease/phosphatase family protein [Rosistilla oblonga]
MKQFIKYLVLAAMALSPVSASYSSEPLRLRVLSYNIHHGAGVDSKLDLQRIADVILSVKPDVVALQEVDKNVKRSGDVDQPAELARLTKMNVVFGANIDLQGGHYGNAILSRFPIIRHENHRLPNIDGGEQRGMIEAEIALPKSNQPLLLLATHLDHRPDESERLASAAFINKRLAGKPQHPALLAGDMNARPDSETLRRLQANWTSSNQTPMATYPVTQPTIQIDYILHSPAKRWKVIEFKVLDEAVASDHRAIFAILELQTDDE